MRAHFLQISGSSLEQTFLQLPGRDPLMTGQNPIIDLKRSSRTSPCHGVCASPTPFLNHTTPNLRGLFTLEPQYLTTQLFGLCFQDICLSPDGQANDTRNDLLEWPVQN